MAGWKQAHSVRPPSSDRDGDQRSLFDKRNSLSAAGRISGSHRTWRGEMDAWLCAADAFAGQSSSRSTSHSLNLCDAIAPDAVARPAVLFRQTPTCCRRPFVGFPGKIRWCGSTIRRRGVSRRRSAARVARRYRMRRAAAEKSSSRQDRFAMIPAFPRPSIAAGNHALAGSPMLPICRPPIKPQLDRYARISYWRPTEVVEMRRYEQ